MNIFDELFVLEMANNHLGNLERGLKIISDFGHVVRYNSVRAAIKLQLRDAGTFVHQRFRDRRDLRYIKKTMDTMLPKSSYRELAKSIHRHNCMIMATPFDEYSVDFAVELGCEVLKIASSDMNDWPLIERIAKTKLPVIASVGGSSLPDMDALVAFFMHRNIPLALNHCVSLYPTRDENLELNQIDFMRDRYPDITIGFSTHEHNDWHTSIAIAYAKGARTFERHVDIETPDALVSSYCSTPEQIDEWFRAFKRAKAMCGAPGIAKRACPADEVRYLDALVRGCYASRDLPTGHILKEGDFYLAIPLQRGQISCRELIVDDRLSKPVREGDPITIHHLSNIYAENPALRGFIEGRGL